MRTASRYNLTEGGIANKLLFVAMPLIGTSVIQMTYNLTDMFWLGRLSSDAVAATGIVGLFLWMSFAFQLIGRMGAEIGVSQSLGKGDKGKAQSYAQNAILTSLLIGTAVALIYIFARVPLIGLFGIEEVHVARYAQDYLAIVSMVFPLFFLTSAISGVFNGAGNSRMSLKINAVGLVLNMVLSPIFIFPLGLGVVGAAIATVIAQSAAAIVAIVSLLKHKSRPFEDIKFILVPNVDIIKQIFKWVLPISVESFFFTLLTMIATGFIAYFGAGALAAARVSNQLESLTWLVAGGFGSALTAFVGQNFGAKKWNRILRSFKISSAMMIAWGAMVGLLLFFGARALVTLFIPDDPEVVALGATYLQILAIGQIPGCLEGVAGGLFRGRGKTIPPSVVSISSNVSRVILAYILAFHTPLGLNGIWIAMSAGMVLRGMGQYIWYLIDMRGLPKEDEPATVIQVEG